MEILVILGAILLIFIFSGKSKKDEPIVDEEANRKLQEISDERDRLIAELKRIFDTYHFPKEVIEPNKDSVKFDFEIKGIKFQDEECIEIARNLKPGDPICMMREDGNEFDEYAVFVLSMEGKILGYVDGGLSKFCNINIEKLQKFVVKKVKGEYAIPYVHVTAYFDPDVVYPEDDEEDDDDEEYDDED